MRKDADVRVVVKPDGSIDEQHYRRKLYELFDSRQAASKRKTATMPATQVQRDDVSKGRK